MVRDVVCVVLRGVVSVWCVFLPRAGGAFLLKEDPASKSIGNIIFEVLGGRKSSNNWSGSSIRQKLGCKSILGGSWGRFGNDLGTILGPNIDSKGIPKQADF